MKHMKYCGNTNTETHKTRETNICGSPNLGYVHEEATNPSFNIIHQNEEMQPTIDPL